MENNVKVMMLKHRIHSLTQRDPVTNKRIINKLNRRLRNLLR